MEEEEEEEDDDDDEEALENKETGRTRYLVVPLSAAAILAAPRLAAAIDEKNAQQVLPVPVPVPEPPPPPSPPWADDGNDSSAINNESMNTKRDRTKTRS